MTISSRFLLPASLGLGLLVWACGSDDLPPSQTGDGDGDGDVGDGDGDVGDGDGDGDGDVGDGDGDASGGTAGDGDGDGSGGTTGDGDGDVTPQVDPAGESCALGTNYYLGEMRILNNQWTSHQDDQCIFINEDRSFGWSWDNGNQPEGFMELPGGNPDYPNYPEVEFGINPWGREMDEWEIGTSSTTLLPIRLGDLTQASMTIDVESTTDGGGSWNLAFELWLSPVDPTTQETSPSAELMVFFGNDSNYYPSTQEASTPDGAPAGYELYVSDNSWAAGYWYRQWRRDGSTGTSASFDGTLDIKALLDVSGFDQNWYITRFEIGNEVYAGSAGDTTIRSLSFSVNGESRSAM